ncbi:MAG: hypothetical protein K2X93_12435 [Candidatus Obscuribacterales bacterium]|nr:hypothetical protein [Candidatus Obscuribacterales bacterium]
MFDATKYKMRNITFQQVDIDNNNYADLVRKYSVSGIPRLVFLDAGDNVLYNGGAVKDENAFLDKINSYK